MYVVKSKASVGLILALTFAASACALDTVGQTEQNVSGDPAVSTDQPTYTVGDTVTLNYSGMPGNMYDWVAISVAGSDPTSYLQWDYIDGAISGSQAFTGLAVGNYEARGYVNDSYTIIASSTFSVTGSTATTISTDMQTYSPGEIVTVNYANMPGNEFDWVSVSVAGSPATSFVKYVYTDGAINGSNGFAGIPAGSYEARAYVNDSYTIIASSTFTVAGTPHVSTDETTYTAGQVVNLSWSGLPGNQLDWVSVSVAGSPATSFVKYVYTDGAIAGSNGFTGIPVGSYEARAYVNDSYTILATSTFTVTSGAVTPSISTDSSSYATDQPITVTFTNLPGNMDDWVDIAVAGSPDTSFVKYVYTDGAINGSHVFGGIAAGNYEARAYSNDSYNRLATTTFTVTP